MKRLILVALVALAVGFGAGAIFGRAVFSRRDFNTVYQTGDRMHDEAMQMHQNFLTAM